MNAGASGPRYDRIAQALHWLMALALIAVFAIGLWMVAQPLMVRLKTVPLHKTLGVTVFLLACLRLAWRATHPAPALPASMPRWERIAASAAHHLLYLLMFAVPLSGWLMSSALGFASVPFGLFKLPDLLARDRELGDTLKVVHFALNKAFATLVLLHVAAALKHHFIDRDGVLQRMLPAGNRKS